MAMEIIFMIIRTYLMMCFWDLLFNWKNFRHYDKIYAELHTKNFYLWKEESVVITDPLFMDEMFIWSYKRNSFGLKKGVYLTNTPMYYINSPYSLYWYLKYKKWFNDRFDATKFEEIT